MPVVQSFTFTCISLYWVSGCQAGMVLNKHFFIKDSLCLITCNKKYFMLSGVIGNMSGICWTHKINCHWRINLFFQLENGRWQNPKWQNCMVWQLQLNLPWIFLDDYAWDHLVSDQNELINDHSLYIHWQRGIPSIIFLLISC